MAEPDNPYRATAVSFDTTGGKMSFAFSATDRSGRKVMDRIVASSVDDAWANLEAQGYRDITLLDSEITAIKLDDAKSRRRLIFSVEESRALRRQRSFAIKTLRLLLRPASLYVWGSLVLWLGYLIVRYGWPSNSAWITIGLILLYFLRFAWAHTPSLIFNRALDASAWADWPKAEMWMRRMATWKRWFNRGIAEREILLRIATAEAGQGRLDDALRRVAPLANDPGMAPGMYHARLASVYHAAKDYANEAFVQQESRRIKPTPSNAIDLATTLARRLDNPDDAEKLLAQVELAKLAPIAQAFYWRCQGLIAFHRQQASAARDYLEQSLSIAHKEVGSPLMQGVVADTRAYYALALVQCGQPEDAAAHFAASRPLLLAHRETALLALCDAAQRRG